jgi:hypothetical protein
MTVSFISEQAGSTLELNLDDHRFESQPADQTTL